MPATTVIPAAPVQPAARTPAPALSLEARMAAVDAAMTIRLETASLANDINTAHIDTPMVDLADVIRAPVDAPRAPVDLYPTPVAALLQRAHQRLTRDGWCAGALRNTDGARCLLGAIRIEAGGNRGAEAKGLEVLMDAIRRRFGNDIESVWAFNDTHGTARIPLRLLGEAADLADTRGI